MLKKIKEMVTEKEVKALDEVVKKIYDVVYDNNYTTAYNMGFNAGGNLNGSGYENLIRIVDNLKNDEGEADFAKYVLKRVFCDNKIAILKKELLENRDRYITLLYL